jgi:glycine hydroxymethyltransferase
MYLLPEDRELFELINREADRQEGTLNLIASENYTSTAVLEAAGSVLTNKYAEGYPGKRYYAGCHYVDQAELLAIERVKKLFNAEHANVQPHAGSQANMAVFFAALKPGDTFLGMSLAEGGHLTHGHRVNFSGVYYTSVPYFVTKETELLDYDEIERLALEHRPKLIIAGASAYSRTIDYERFGAIARQVNALLMVDMAHIAGLIAAGLHPNPFPHADFVTSTTHKTLRGPRGGLILCKKEYAAAIDKAVMPGTQGGPFMHNIAAKAVAFHEAAQEEFKHYQQQVITNAQAMTQKFTDLGYRIVSGGTDNHLFIVDLHNKNITGKEAELALEQAGITVSRSCIPFDPKPSWITSGIRIGTPPMTTRGMQKAEAAKVVELIDEALLSHDNPIVLAQVKAQVQKLCSSFPINRTMNPRTLATTESSTLNQ